MSAFGVATDTLLFSLCYDELLAKNNAEDGDGTYKLYSPPSLADFAESIDGHKEAAGDDEKKAEDSDAKP